MAPKRLKEDPPPAAASSGEEEDSDNDVVSEEEEENDAVQDKEKSEDEVDDDDEDDDDDDDEEDDEDEEEEDKDKKKEQEASPAGKLTSTSTPSSKPSKPQTHDDSGSGSDSETDSDNEKSPPSPSASDFTIKPIASKPMDPKKPATITKPKTPTPIPASGSKRPAAADPNPNSKKRKVVPSSTTTNGEDEDPKKGHSGNTQRLWSEDDELVILKGMIEYQSKKGSDPYSEMGAFLEFIKKSLRVEVSKNQLMDKIRRMKKKYQVNVEKGGDNGEDPVFSKPHEQKAFELSKKIWGVDAGSNRKAKPNSKAITNSNNNNLVALALPRQEAVVAKKKEKEKVKEKEKKEACLDNGEVKDEKKEEFMASYPCLNEVLETGEGGLLGLGMGFKRELMAGIGSAKATELETKWRKVKEAELEVYVKRVELVLEQAKMMLDAIKKMA
ncbi:STOREKEEPER protein-like [Fagus crenata]